ncbi:MAG: DUF192 domain-containing protein [Elusimicrobia bacterium]|nr:DUF192 domain-containing protein [Elusimicrobiota bacterium]
MVSTRLYNSTRKAPLAENVRRASGFFQKIRGLLGTKPLGQGEALVIPSICPQVHTFFMSYPIDVLFLNKHGLVVGMESLKPWRLSRLYRQADRIVELPEGTIKKHGVSVGDKIEEI